MIQIFESHRLGSWLLENHLIVAQFPNPELHIWNPSGAAIWLLLSEEQLTIEEICSEIKSMFRSESESIHNDLISCLNQWIKFGWVQLNKNGKYSFSQTTDQPFHPVEAVVCSPKESQTLSQNIFSLQGNAFKLTIRASKGSEFNLFFNRLNSLTGGFAKTSIQPKSEITVIIDKDVIYLKRDEQPIQAYEDFAIALSHCIQYFLAISAGDNSHFLTLHAGAMGLDKALLFCGVSGAGKSTLCAHLSSMGWQYFGDDIVGLKVSEKNLGQIVPLPFAASVKEGNWHLLSKKFPQLDELEALNYGEKVAKFLPLPYSDHSSNETTLLNAIIFPEYSEGSATQVEKISVIDALHHLVTSGISLHPEINKDEVKSFLELMCQTPTYKLKYSNIDEANAWLTSLAKN